MACLAASHSSFSTSWVNRGADGSARWLAGRRACWSPAAQSHCHLCLRPRSPRSPFLWLGSLPGSPCHCAPVPPGCALRAPQPLLHELRFTVNLLLHELRFTANLAGSSAHACKGRQSSSALFRSLGVAEPWPFTTALRACLQMP